MKTNVWKSLGAYAISCDDVKKHNLGGVLTELGIAVTIIGTAMTFIGNCVSINAKNDKIIIGDESVKEWFIQEHSKCKKL